MPVTGGVGGPLLYAVILGYVGLVAAALYNLVFQSIVGSSFGAFHGRMAEFERLGRYMEGGVGAIVQLVDRARLDRDRGLRAAGILHLLLMLVGRRLETSRPRSGWWPTPRPSASCLLPFCGGLIGFVWWVVS